MGNEILKAIESIRKSFIKSLHDDDEESKRETIISFITKRLIKADLIHPNELIRTLAKEYFTNGEISFSTKVVFINNLQDSYLLKQEAPSWMKNFLIFHDLYDNVCNNLNKKLSDKEKETLVGLLF